MLTAILALLAIVVDTGLLFGERRAAQKDVDAAALAGAQELAKDLRAVPGGAEDTLWAANGEDQAFNWLQRNHVDTDSETTSCPTAADLGDAGTDANVCADTSCFAGEVDIGLIDSVTVDLQAPSHTLLARIFGSDIVEVGAHAKACVGSLKGTTGLRPWTISLYNSEKCFEWVDDGDGVKEADDDLFLPWYGEDCVIRLESPSSQVGTISLGDEVGDECNEPGGGAAKLDENIVEGADAYCEIGDLVDSLPGLKVGPTLDSLECLLEGDGGSACPPKVSSPGEGACDAEFCTGSGCNGIDEFSESFSPPKQAPTHEDVFKSNGCWTPRAVDIVMIDEFGGPGASTPVRILGFASFFILQCEEIDPTTIDPVTGEPVILNVYPKCDVPGGAAADMQIRGRFMQVLKSEGMGGALDPFGTRIVFLTE